MSAMRKPGAPGVTAGEDRGRGADREQRRRSDSTAATIVGAVPLPNRNGITGSAAPIANATNDDPPATHGEPSVDGSSPSSSRASVSSATSLRFMIVSTSACAASGAIPLAR